LFSKYKLARSNEHFRRIHPTEAAAVDEHLAGEKARAEAKAKAAAEAKAKAAAAPPANPA
jgi:NADH-quinone oxidoreductase subunit I